MTSRINFLESTGDLADADFRTLSLDHADLSDTDCSRADFRELDLRRLSWKRVKLRGARFAGAKLLKEDRGGLLLAGADMNEGGPRGRYAPSPSPLVLPHVVPRGTLGITSDLKGALWFGTWEEYDSPLFFHQRPNAHRVPEAGWGTSAFAVDPDLILQSFTPRTIHALQPRRPADSPRVFRPIRILCLPLLIPLKDQPKLPPGVAPRPGAGRSQAKS